MSPDRSEVFISYNRDDKSFVDFLVRALEGAGVSVFQDVTGLQVFDKLDASLKAAIARSRWLVAVISPGYLRSYWCLFEAIEAIQGQDLEQRFMPIVLRYSANDQTLDEDFVLKALRDLDEQMSVFETQIVRMKAFELSAKLDKLRYVRTNLPGVFRHMHERIFPEFTLWDDRSIRTTLKQVLQRLAPANTFVHALELSFERHDATPVVIPKLKPLPSVLWAVRVGCQTRTNSPLVVGNAVYVGSAGSRWNQPDEQDGIYCLDAETGAQKWFAPAPADTNQLMMSKGRVVTGCDDGTVIAVSAAAGTKAWWTTLDSGIVGGPIKLSANIGTSTGYAKSDDRRDPFVVVTHSGGVYLLDLATGAVLQHLSLGRTVSGDAALGAAGYKDVLWIPCTGGTLIAVEYDNIYVSIAVRGETVLQYADRFSSAGQSIAGLSARPLPAGDRIVQGIVRRTYYDAPPLVAVDAQTGQIRWTARLGDRKDSFGNLRSTPVVVGGEVVFSTAYSAGLGAVSLDDGTLQWTVDLSQPMFEQWSGPIARGHAVYLGRHDGYLHKVDVRARQREWSLFIGHHANAGSAVSAEQALPEFDARSSWVVGGATPILATPTIDRGRLYVGTFEGYLYCIVNLGNDGPDAAEDGGV
jgi:outer membrane protein assembly factor BamB